jgi:hypothetical protein
MSKDVKLLDEEFDKTAKILKYKPCPKCKFWIEKSEVISFLFFYFIFYFNLLSFYLI